MSPSCKCRQHVLTCRHDMTVLLKFGQMGPCCRHRIEDVAAVCVGLSQHLPDFPKCVCRNILWYGSTYAQIQPHNHTTTLPQHTTTKMSHCCPTLQRLWPSPSMGRPAAPLTHGAAAPYGPIQGARHRVRRHHCWFPCLGHRNATHQKTEKEAGSWSWWPPFRQYTQQPTKSRWKRKG